MTMPTPAELMQSAGIVQEGDPVLTQVTTPFHLPAEASEAGNIISRLIVMLDRLRLVHDFPKGMGIAAPQIGISRAAAVIHAPRGVALALLNPRIVFSSPEIDEQHEGCLSFFGVRGIVPRPLVIDVIHEDTSGMTVLTTLKRGAARLACHEIDHLNGILYRNLVKPGTIIPVSAYDQEGQAWQY